MPFSKEDVTALAFKVYKEDKSMDESIWHLSELCVTINKNIIDGFNIKPLETDNLVVLIRPDVNGQIIRPDEDEIREVAEIIYNENPSKSQLDWFIAEKTLLLRELEEIIRNNRE
ncbi:MAG: hypothetical protein ACTSR8_02915 [Promethearchaeota archaeon]